jgi:hypothetical protein
MHISFDIEYVSDDSEFISSSVSLLELEDKILANVRFVNYRIDSNGNYIYKNNKIITRNGFIFLNYDMKPISEITFMSDKLNDLISKDSIIIGLEDIRLFYENNKICYTD